MIGDVFNRLIGSVNVDQSHKRIVISGAPGRTITRDLDALMKTSVISKYMFTTVTNNRLEIPLFFAMELDYLLRAMIAAKRNVYSSKATLQACLTELRQKTWLADIEAGDDIPLNLANLKRINMELLPHQKRFLAWYAHAKNRYGLRGMLLAAAPGAGKTISGISVAEVTDADAVIVIAPNNAVENVWAKTLANDMTLDTPHWVSRNRDKVPVPKNCKYFLYHYEDLPLAITMVDRGIIKGKICVILDESHNFNDPKSQRTQRFELLCKLTKSEDIVYSSGTPIKAMGADMVPLLRVLDPLFTEEVEIRFKKIYGKNAAKANDMLANRLAIISYKVPKSEFMVDKPIEQQVPIKIPHGEHFTLDAIKVRMQEFINQRVKFYNQHEREYTETYFRCLNIAEPLFTKEQRVNYKEYQENIRFFRKYGFDSRTDGAKAVFCNKFEKEAVIPLLSNEDKKLFRDAKSVYKYVSLKIRGECLGNVLGRERIAANVEIAKVLNYSEFIDNAEKKTIFFSSHTEVVNEVISRTNKLGYRPLMVTAETNHMLKQIVKKYETDPKANPLAATYQSLSTAVPMTAANVIVAMNTPFRIHEMEQAIARSWRLGQDKPVYVYFCTLDTGDKPNITTRSADIMEWSREQVNQIMGYSSRDDLILDDVGLEGFSCEEYHHDITVSELQNDAMIYQTEINKFHDIDDSIAQTIHTDLPGELGPESLKTTQNNQQVDSTMEGFI